MCNKTKCAAQYTVDLINNNISRDVQEGCANRLNMVYTVGTESIQTPLNFSLFVVLQPFAKII